MEVAGTDSDAPFQTPFLLRIGSPGSPLAFLCLANAGRQTQYGGCWTAGAGFDPGQHSDSRSGGGSCHPPPFPWVVGLPQSNNARHDNAFSKLTVHGCSEVGRQSYTCLGGVGSSQSMVPLGVCRPQKGYPYQLPHTSVLASDHEPNRRIPYTQSVASDCGEGKLPASLARVRLLICLTYVHTRTPWLVSKREK